MFSFLATALVIAAPAQAASPLTPDEQAQLQHNIELGTLLYRYDQSAWHVTDAAMVALSDEMKQRIRGYVTTPAADGFRTSFFSEDPSGYHKIYSAVWTGSAIEGAENYSAGRGDALSQQEQRLVEARKLALDSAGSRDMCSAAQPNIIVVPDPIDTTIHVYVLTPETKENVFPLGGHYRIDVRDGRIDGQRAFTKSCLDFDMSANSSNGHPAAAGITHLLDNIPTEIHVFSVLAMGLPLYVGVKDGRVYVVETRAGVASARLVSPGATP